MLNFFSLLAAVLKQLKKGGKEVFRPGRPPSLKQYRSCGPGGRQKRIIIQVEIHVAPQAKASSNRFFKV